MKGYFILFFCIASLSVQVCTAQVKGSVRSKPLNEAALAQIQIAEDTLAVLARGVLVAELAENRMYACHQLIPALVKALKTPNSFHYKFPRLENISIQYPEDSTMRIFSWQLKISEAEYRYFGAIQWNQTDLKLVPLVDRSDQIQEPVNAILTTNNWFGVVYYGMRSFKSTDQKTSYLLFGYDGYTMNERRKIIDILTFKDDIPSFGAPIFKFNKGLTQHRVIYQYGADASIRVNYDEAEKMVVCDHLISLQSVKPGQANVMVPEGSYEGFKYEKGYWKYVEEVFPSNSPENQRAFTTKPAKEVNKKSSKDQ